jgi:hypothetical protein
MLLFNWCGYRWVMNVMQDRADLRLEAKLDRNDYDESELIEIRVPVNMPYQTDWASFERYDGEVEVNGIHYKYVKRKVENGQLVLKCIPNKAKQALETAKTDFFKGTNNLQPESPQKSSVPQSVKNLLSEFDPLQQLVMATSCSTAMDKTYNLYQQRPPAGFFVSTPEQPPEC